MGKSGYRRNLTSVSTRDQSRHGHAAYWSKRVELSKIEVDWEKKKAVDLEKKRKVKLKLERLQMIKELAEL
jgi:hypothetical protein